MNGPSSPPDPGIAVHDLLAGWDVAYVTSLSAMNAALRKQKLWPRAISVADPDVSGRTLSATVADVRLAVDSRAVGGLIVLAIDLTAATLSDGFAGPLDCTFFAEAELELVTDQADGRLTKVGTGKSPFLIKKLTGQSSIRLRDPDDSDDNYLALAAIEGPLQAWLDGEMMELALIFAAAIPGFEQVTTGDFHWALPGGLAYAVGIPDIVDDKLPSEDECVFALLGVTDFQNLAGLVPQILPGVLTPDTDAAYLMSSPLLLSTIVGPGMIAGLKTTNSPRLNLSGSSDGVALTNFDAIALPDLDLSSDKGTSVVAQTGSNVRIDSGNLEIRVDGDKIVVSVFQMDFTTAAGAEEVQITFNYETTLAADTSGAVSLTLPATINGGAQIALTEKAIQYEMWSKFVCAVVIALLSLVPGADEAASATEGATEAGVAATGSMETAEITASDAAEIGAQADKELADAASPSLSGFAATFAKKAALMTAIAVAQEAITDAPSLLKMYQGARGTDHVENWLPSLDKIATGIAGTAWFGSDPTTSVKCTAAELNRGLILHLSLGAPS